VERREPSYTVSGNVNWYSHYGEQYGGSLKNSHHTIHQSHSWACMQKNCHSKRYMHSNVHCSTIYNSHHMEVTQMSTNRVMDKENVLYRINYILLSHKKNTIMPFAATWMDLEFVLLSEVRERQISYDIAYMWNLKILAQRNLITKQKQSQSCIDLFL